MKNKKTILMFLIIIQLVYIAYFSSNIFSKEHNERNDTMFEVPEISSCTPSWTRIWNEGLYQGGHDVSSDSANNIYITGYCNYGTSSLDLVLLKYNSSGDLQWDRTWGTANPDRGHEVAVDSSDNVYVSGQAYHDFLLVKYNSSGDLQWNRRWGPGILNFGYGVAIDSSDNIYVGGRVDDDMYLRKYNSSGSTQWTIRYGRDGFQYYANGVAVDSSDNIYIVGEAGLAGMGDTIDVFVAKYNSSGNQLWNHTWGSSGADSAYGVTVDSTNNIYVTGNLASGGVFLLKYDNNGNLMWNCSWIYGAHGRDVVVDSSDNVYIIGKGWDAEGEFLLLKYSPQGDLLLSCMWGGGGDDVGGGVVLDSLNNIYLTGIHNRASAQGNIVLVKYDPILSIIINNPNQSEIYGNVSPHYNISIFESNLNTTWYTLDGGTTNIEISQLTGTINQTEWEKQVSGNVTITFYANNSLSNVGSAEVTIIKDIDNPVITIMKPSNGDKFENAPNYIISIVEPNLDSIWYTINNGLDNYTINQLSGTINQTAWKEAPYGNITISFYAKDLIGKIGIDSIIVIKIRYKSSISGFNIIWLIAVLSIISLVIIKRTK